MDVLLKVTFCFYLLFFNLKLYAMPVKYNNELSFLKVIISSSEFEYNKVSNKEYFINSRYYLNPSFVKGVFSNIAEKLEAFKVKETNKPLLLEYITLGNGKKMVTNIAIP